VTVSEPPVARERGDGFDVPAEVLDVPSFLRDG
jgi:hypothetical protein